MRTITMTNAVLALITDDADRTLLEAMKGSDVPENLIEDSVSEKTYATLFANDTTDDDIVNNAQESTMTQTTTTTTATPTIETLTYMGMQFDCERKMDKAFAGKIITSADFGNLSKSMLLAITTWQNEHINAQDAKVMVDQQARAQAPKRPLAKQAQPKTYLETLKAAYNKALTVNQKGWLRTDNRYLGVSFEDLGNGKFKVRFAGFNDKSKKVLGSVFTKACAGPDWYCKVQVSHVYVNMHINK